MSFSPDFAFFSQEERLQLLSGNCPGHLTKPQLTTWHSYREGTAKNGSAQVSSGMYDHSSCPIFVQEWQFFPLKRLQRYLFWRVARHIKNAREDNFTESWKHSASDVINNVDVSSSNTSSPNTLYEFPQAANWCSIHRAEFRPITIENMMNYFVKTIRI